MIRIGERKWISGIQPAQGGWVLDVLFFWGAPFAACSLQHAICWVPLFLRPSLITGSASCLSPLVSRRWLFKNGLVVTPPVMGHDFQPNAFGSSLSLSNFWSQVPHFYLGLVSVADSRGDKCLGWCGYNFWMIQSRHGQIWCLLVLDTQGKEGIFGGICINPWRTLRKRTF